MKTKTQFEAEGLPDSCGLKWFTEAYMEAMYFTDLNHPDKPEFESKELSPELSQRIENECRGFYNTYWRLISGHAWQAGHDFWLTRNGHGAGFWDRPGVYGKLASEVLTEACGFDTYYPQMDLYVGDDGRVYAS